MLLRVGFTVPLNYQTETAEYQRGFKSWLYYPFKIYQTETAEYDEALSVVYTIPLKFIRQRLQSINQA
jgi:hypothetical protein